MNRDFLKEAIADAKAVKESAIANAKVALEEAFTPQLRSMLAKRLEEMDEAGDGDEGYDEMAGINDPTDFDPADWDESLDGVDQPKIPYYPNPEGDNDYEPMGNEDLHPDRPLEEEMDLDEILAELDALEEEENPDEITEAKEDEEAEEAEEDEEGEKEETFDIEEMSEEDLIKFVEEVIKDMVEAGELEAGEGQPGEEGAEGEEDIELDLGVEGDETEEPEVTQEGYSNLDEEKENVKYVYVLNAQGKPDLKKMIGTHQYGKGFIPNQLGIKMGFEKHSTSIPNGTMIEKDEDYLMEKDLREAYKAIKSLRSELQEVNLLNAKLLYTNKIFRSKSLNDAQKVKILETFDKATTVNEVKLVYETLSESLSTNNLKKKSISEGIVGSASKSAGAVSQAKKPIVESNDMVARFQKLAGLN